MVNRVTTVRKIAFSIVLPCWLCYLPESAYPGVLGVFNKYARLGRFDRTSLSEPPWSCLSVLSKGRGVSCSF